MGQAGDQMANIAFGNRGRRNAIVADEEPQNILKRFPSFIGTRRPSHTEKNDATEALLLLRNFEESGQGWLWATDQHGHLTYLTESVSQLLSVEGGTLVGTSFTDLFVRAEDASGS
ncbi:MAG: hypothetical protein JWN69_1059, partial [Alphaproteobacteria bacterium]|nr:hypothetical protein [Alphaproteobacteria bacterium]